MRNTKNQQEIFNKLDFIIIKNKINIILIYMFYNINYCLFEF